MKIIIKWLNSSLERKFNKSNKKINKSNKKINKSNKKINQIRKYIIIKIVYNYINII